MSFHNSCVWLNKNTSCVKVDKQEFVWEYFLSLMSYSDENKSCMRVDESWQARVCMRVFSTLMSWSNKNTSCMRVDESWQARVCMRVFSNLMSWSNENKSCMRVDESWQARVCMRVFSNFMSWSNEDKSCMRVDESWQARVLYHATLFVLTMRVEKTLIQTLACQLSSTLMQLLFVFDQNMRNSQTYASYFA